MTIDWKVNFGNFQPANRPLVTKVKDFFTKYADCEFEGPKLAEVPPWRIGRLTVDNKLLEEVNKQEPEIVLKAAALEHLEKYQDYLHIYTDGSKTENGRVAAAFCIPQLNIPGV